MGNFTTAFVIVMVLNVLMSLTQLSITNIGLNDPTAYGSEYFHCEGTLLGHYTDNCQKLVDSRNPRNDMPQQSNIPSSSGGFGDIISVILGWFADIPGLNYVISILLGFSSILHAMLPNENAFVIIVSGAWYGLTLWLSIAFAVWRD